MFTILSWQLYSQELSNLRHKNVDADSDSIYLDTLSIIPASEIITFQDGSRIIDDSLYYIDYLQSILFIDSSLYGNNIEIQYRVFDKKLSKPYSHREPPKYFATSKKEEYDVFKVTSQPTLFKQESIFKNGTFSRGISFGNNQDVVLNSGLDFQLSGKLGDKMYVRGSVTDKNIPLQPDGYTQQIQEFDKIYIQVYDSVSEFTMGDYEIHYQQNFFRVNKKAQGVMYEGKLQLRDNIKYSPVVSGAVAKGIYHRIKIQGQEGNQGPYKLTGVNNEQFIIILAGSETVYVDGHPLKRGQNNDYIIDYNNAEVRFTPNRPITKDSRIIIEFEYSERNYTRFMMFVKNEFESSKGKCWFNYYTEQDAKNQPIQQDLSDDEKLTLSNIGDNLNNAIVSGAVLDTFVNPLEQVLYKEVIEIVNGDTFIYYTYSTNSDSAIYRVSFSQVGMNKGDYIQEITAVNGKVFKYVGKNNGDYLPVKRIISPKKHSLIDVGGVYKLNSYVDIFSQLTFSNRDVNTYSVIDDHNNVGHAFKGGLSVLMPLSDTVNHKLRTNVEYQRISKDFIPLERFRSVEFERDWNIIENSTLFNEQFLKAGIDYSHKDYTKINYQFETLNRNNLYNGYKNNIFINSTLGKNELGLSGSSLFTDDTINYTQFHRYTVHFSHYFKKVVVGIKNESELNKWHNKITDSLLLNSFGFNTTQFFISNNEQAVNKYKLSVDKRLDFLPERDLLNKSSDAINIKLDASINSIQNHIINTTILYRELNYVSKNQVSEKNILGRLQHNMRLLGSGITTSTLYEISSGLEPKQEFTYLEVTKGQGIYKWDNTTDYNQNGIPELNEFEVAKYADEANYIKILLPSTEYVPVYGNQFNVVLNVVPQKIFHKTNGFISFIKPFSNTIALSTTQKIKEGNAKDVSVPFSSIKPPSNLINFNTSLRNTFSWNKTHSKYGVDYIYSQNHTKVILLNGIDTKQTTNNELLLRYKPANNITLLNTALIKRQLFDSEFFKTRNYSITTYGNDVTVGVQPNINSQFDLTYSFNNKTNTDTVSMGTIPQAIIHNGEINIIVSMKNNFRIEILGGLTYIDYNELENTSLAYEMLEGLKIGKNFNWGVQLNRKLPNGLEINLNYHGRVSENTKVIHTGGMEARLYF